MSDIIIGLTVERIQDVTISRGLLSVSSSALVILSLAACAVRK